MNDIPAGIPEAPAWSLFTGLAGKVCVDSAMVFFAISMLLWIFWPSRQPTQRAAKLSFTLGCLSLFTAFGALALLFIKDQFQFAYVFEHGEHATDFKYKLAGVWSSQEGSFLLWACTSALFGLLTVRGTGPYRRWFTATYSVFLAVLSGILAYETPFNVLPGAIAHGKTFVMPNGEGMTPALQNYWIVIHPPIIFLGYGSLTVGFAYAVSALLTGDAKDWLARVRPWALVTTAILGLGICLGGFWAYETLGWGGFWGWDPVENMSAIPWLFTVVLVHGLLVQATRGRWALANLFLGGLPFLSFLYGTFLTRSGLLDKVSNHSFAEMDQHALGILRWFLMLISFSFLALWFWKGKSSAALVTKDQSEEEAGLHREGFYRFGMLFLAMLAVVLGFGMSWPVIVAWRGGEGAKIEEGLYHLVTVWFFIPTMLLMAVGPFVTWRKMGWQVLWARIFTVVCTSIGLTGFAQLALMDKTYGVQAASDAMVATPFHFQVSLRFWMLLLVFLCIFVAVGNIWRISELVKRSPLGIGGFIAHLGLATLMGGLIISRGYQQEDQIFVRPGQPAVALGNLVTYKGRTDTALDDRSSRVFFDVQSPNGQHYQIDPNIYLTKEVDENGEPKWMSWPYILRQPSHDVYYFAGGPMYNVWPGPQTLKPGESFTQKGVTVQYVKSTMKGQPGTVGVTFGALVTLTADGQDGERHQYQANPTIKLTEDGLEPSIAPIGPDFSIAIAGGMNAEDKSVQLVLMFTPPFYPMTVFYKPLTSLVWGGAGIMTLGGLISAWSRRRVKAKESASAETARKKAKKGTSPDPQFVHAAEGL